VLAVVVKKLHGFKKYLALHIATVGIAMTAAGLALFVKTKKEENQQCAPKPAQ
jgi:hypothetical protein